MMSFNKEKPVQIAKQDALKKWQGMQISAYACDTSLTHGI